MNNPSTDFEAKTAGITRARDHPEWISDPNVNQRLGRRRKRYNPTPGVGLRTLIHCLEHMALILLRTILQSVLSVHRDIRQTSPILLLLPIGVLIIEFLLTCHQSIPCHRHRKAKWVPSRYDHLFPIHLIGKREFVVPYNHSQGYKEVAQEAVRLLNLGSEEGIVLSFVIAHLEVNVPKSKCITRTGGPWTTPDSLRADSDIELSLPQLPKFVMSVSDIPICDSSD